MPMIMFSSGCPLMSTGNRVTAPTPETCWANSTAAAVTLGTRNATITKTVSQRSERWVGSAGAISVTCGVWKYRGGAGGGAYAAPAYGAPGAYVWVCSVQAAPSQKRNVDGIPDGSGYQPCPHRHRRPRRGLGFGHGHHACSRASANGAPSGRRTGSGSKRAVVPGNKKGGRVRYGSLMAETFVTVERRPDGVALVRLDRPKANALSAAVLGQLEAAATELRDDPPGAVVLWGGRRIFAAGADIVELGGDRDGGGRGELRRRTGGAGVHPTGDDRGRQRLRSGRRAGAGARLRLPGVLRGRPLRAARGAARRHPRWRRHPAAAPADRLVAGQGDDHDGAPGPRRGGAGDRSGEPGGGAGLRARGRARRGRPSWRAGPVLAHGFAKGAVDLGLEGRWPTAWGSSRRRSSRPAERRTPRSASARSRRTARARPPSSAGEHVSSPPIPVSSHEGRVRPLGPLVPARRLLRGADPRATTTPITTAPATCGDCGRSSTTSSGWGSTASGCCPSTPRPSATAATTSATSSTSPPTTAPSATSSPSWRTRTAGASASSPTSS